MKGEDGWGILDTWGITVNVLEKTDQSTLPPEDRIPTCLEGIPVQIIEGILEMVPLSLSRSENHDRYQY